MKYRTFKKQVDVLQAKIQDLNNNVDQSLLRRIERYDKAIAKLSGSMEYEHLTITSTDPYSGEPTVEVFIPLSDELIKSLIKSLEADKRATIREFDTTEELPF